MKLKTIVREEIKPRENKNCFELCFFIIEENVAICDAPIEGRKPIRHERSVEISKFGRLFFNLICFIVVIFCFGICVFCFMVKIKEEEPNNPVNKGRRGSFIGKFNVARPKKPARRKIINAEILYFSLKINIVDKIIKINDMNGVTISFSSGRENIKIGARKMTTIIEIKQPNNVIVTASWAFPCKSIL